MRQRTGTKDTTKSSYGKVVAQIGNRGQRPRDPRLETPEGECIICRKKVKGDYDVCIRCEQRLELPYLVPIEEEIIECIQENTPRMDHLPPDCCK